jgi:hypothetical protein
MSRHAARDSLSTGHNLKGGMNPSEFSSERRTACPEAGVGDGSADAVGELAKEGEGLVIVGVDGFDCRLSTDLIQSRKPRELRVASG